MPKIPLVSPARLLRVMGSCVLLLAGCENRDSRPSPPQTSAAQSSAAQSSAAQSSAARSSAARSSAAQSSAAQSSAARSSVTSSGTDTRRNEPQHQPLELTHQQIAARLGPHQMTCRSTLITKTPRAGENRVEQEVTLRINKEGHFEGTKNTHDQYGQEVVWTGHWLFSRLRYSKFTRRKARSQEPPQLADRLTGLLPAYVRLLGPFMEIKQADKEMHLNREVIRVSLQKASPPRRHGPSEGAAQKWRQTISVTTLNGMALLDAKTKCPLSVSLKAHWTFHPPQGSPPDKTGIPTQINTSAEGSMDLQFTQEITEIGKDILIVPPPSEQVITNPNRMRLEIERQMLIEELPINKKMIHHPRAERSTRHTAGVKK